MGEYRFVFAVRTGGGGYRRDSRLFEGMKEVRWPARGVTLCTPRDASKLHYSLSGRRTCVQGC